MITRKSIRPHAAFRIQNSEFRIRHGFTLIEMLVVITIIAILMAAIVAVGTAVRANANRRSTLAELKVLNGVMQDYIADGNAEPSVPDLVVGPASITPPITSPNGWYYGLYSDGSFRGNEAYNRTSITTTGNGSGSGSDPYNWVIALESNPKYAKKLAGLPNKIDSDIPSAMQTSAADPSPIPHQLILDSFGTAIRYVPSTVSATGRGYFMSAGPDGKFSNAMTNVAPTSPNYKFLHGNGAAIVADEIYSTDPQ